MGWIAVGGDRWGGPAVVVAAAPCGTRIAPAGGLPPTGGGWWLYHSFSTQFTMLAPPWSRAHSEKREVNELPRAGFVRAPPSEKASHTQNAAKASPRTSRNRRRL